MGCLCVTTNLPHFCTLVIWFCLQNRFYYLSLGNLSFSQKRAFILLRTNSLFKPFLFKENMICPFCKAKQPNALHLLTHHIYNCTTTSNFTSFSNFRQSYSISAGLSLIETAILNASPLLIVPILTDCLRLRKMYYNFDFGPWP